MFSNRRGSSGCVGRQTGRLEFLHSLNDRLCIVVKSQAIVKDTALVTFLSVNVKILVLRLAPDDWEEPQEKLRLLIGGRRRPY
jgi:hypothetical protein